ncbi:hypothetical protein EDB81DRAFT_879325 [Dactylonectria macrodidyma]|uniref:NAD(P)-binding protein n=1 Tax=Dactylonectria macrodidyma TaxID=307937 RepID=A0A9P9FFR1_9HYPO|nr:hypothetical protein EDB81DRAFT_879325 [Dactylonectria macrodidyma]
MTNSNKQRSVLITGAGNALALEFKAKGYPVFATARSLKTLTNLQETSIETLTLDVTKVDRINALKAEISSRTGGSLDILFNNAGTLYEAPAIEADSARVRSLFDANVFGLMEMVTAFTPLGRSGPLTHDHQRGLCAAVAAYSDTLRLELDPLGIKVKTLHMGEVPTPLMATDNINFGPERICHVVEDAARARTTTHLDKTMPPTEFAHQVVGEVIKGKTPYVWKGLNAFLVWLLNAVGPRSVFDSLMVKAAGLDSKEARTGVFKRGQDMAKSKQ